THPEPEFHAPGVDLLRHVRQTLREFFAIVAIVTESAAPVAIRLAGRALVPRGVHVEHLYAERCGRFYLVEKSLLDSFRLGAPNVVHYPGPVRQNGRSDA